MDIIHLDSSPAIRKGTRSLLQEEYGHNVLSFKDRVSFERAEKEGNFSGLQDIVIVSEVLLVDDLGDSDGAWTDSLIKNGSRLTGDEYKLGVTVGLNIRDGRYESISLKAPLLYFSTQIRGDVLTEAPKLACAYVGKPAFGEEIQAGILEAIDASKR